jgi:hypothetical protein
MPDLARERELVMLAPGIRTFSEQKLNQYKEIGKGSGEGAFA